MSNNRLAYDKCLQHEKSTEDSNSLGYIMSMDKYENNQKCRNEFGLLGGPQVSEINGNKVDLESILKGLSSSNTGCGSVNPTQMLISGNAGTTQTLVDTTVSHLNSCKITDSKLPTTEE